ncbi:MAG: hypothetical protein WDN29_02665 [Methylovirgula sp.]
MKWLDQVGNDEKTSVAWAFNRASAQTSYLRDLGPNETPDDLNRRQSVGAADYASDEHHDGQSGTRYHIWHGKDRK